MSTNGPVSTPPTPATPCAADRELATEALGYAAHAHKSGDPIDSEDVDEIAQRVATRVAAAVDEAAPRIIEFYKATCVQAHEYEARIAALEGNLNEVEAAARDWHKSAAASEQLAANLRETVDKAHAMLDTEPTLTPRNVSHGALDKRIEKVIQLAAQRAGELEAIQRPLKLVIDEADVEHPEHGIGCSLKLDRSCHPAIHRDTLLAAVNVITSLRAQLTQFQELFGVKTPQEAAEIKEVMEFKLADARRQLTKAKLEHAAIIGAVRSTCQYLVNESDAACLLRNISELRKQIAKRSTCPDCKGAGWLTMGEAGGLRICPRCQTQSMGRVTATRDQK